MNEWINKWVEWLSLQAEQPIVKINYLIQIYKYQLDNIVYNNSKEKEIHIKIDIWMSYFS